MPPIVSFLSASRTAKIREDEYLHNCTQCVCVVVLFCLIANDVSEGCFWFVREKVFREWQRIGSIIYNISCVLLSTCLKLQYHSLICIGQLHLLPQKSVDKLRWIIEHDSDFFFVKSNILLSLATLVWSQCMWRKWGLIIFGQLSLGRLLIGNYYYFFSRCWAKSVFCQIRRRSSLYPFPNGGSIISNKESDCNPVIHLWKTSKSVRVRSIKKVW